MNLGKEKEMCYLSDWNKYNLGDPRSWAYSWTDLENDQMFGRKIRGINLVVIPTTSVARWLDGIEQLHDVQGCYGCILTLEHSCDGIASKWQFGLTISNFGFSLFPWLTQTYSGSHAVVSVCQKLHENKGTYVTTTVSINERPYSLTQSWDVSPDLHPLNTL